VHVLFLEEFACNVDAVARLYERIGVDRTFRPSRLSEKVNASESPTSGIDSSLAQQLQDYFKESNERLRGNLGRELPWTGG
jgi:hypothetical protein